MSQATDETTVPAVLKRPAILAYVAQLLAAGSGWKEGDVPPAPPTTLTLSLPELIGYMSDPNNRAYVARRLSVLTANRDERRARRRR
jgi:hypothetical protein